MKKFFLICMLTGAIGLAGCKNDDDDVFMTFQYDDVQVSLKNMHLWVAAAEKVADDLEAKIAVLEQQGVEKEVIDTVNAKIAELREAIGAFMANPTDETFAAAAQALKEAQALLENIFSKAI